MSGDWLKRDIERIASALERVVHLMETEPINVKIPNLHPSATIDVPRPRNLSINEEEGI